LQDKQHTAGQPLARRYLSTLDSTHSLLMRHGLGLLHGWSGSGTAIDEQSCNRCAKLWRCLPGSERARRSRQGLGQLAASQLS